jgi:CheY-like chemotaxis protein
MAEEKDIGMQKILVADDSIAVRKVAERLLVEAGFGVALAANGEEAMAYLAKDRPDMIVSDVIMPDKSGYEVCAFVRGNPQLAETPVLLISGIVNDEVTKQAESCRADGVLKKPFQGTSLKDKVMELFANRQVAAPAQPAQIGLKPEPLSAAGHVDPQAAIKLREVEEQLRSERARSQSLEKRIADLEAEVSRGRETGALLEAERRRANELESKMAVSETQALRVSQLEVALRAEEEATAKARQEAVLANNSADQIVQLEAALSAERMAAAQLVQQLTELEGAATRGNNAEMMLASEMQRAAEFEQKARAAEAELIAARTQGADQASAEVQKLEALLVSERERNAALVHRVSESEMAAMNATKRFEEMARKLGEIAGLASQLGKGTS